MPQLALGSLRVIALTQLYAGPYATRLLADMGAEVIKVESAIRTGRGSLAVQGGAVYPDGEPGEKPYNRIAYYNELNRNHLAISLNLFKEEGRGIFLALVRVSDVVVENFSARVMPNFGLDYPILAKVRPEIIMLSMPAYGVTGPYRDYVGYGTGIEAMSGLSAMTGYECGPPLSVGIAYADPNAGLHAAFAILTALRYRRRTGKGQFIDLSQREALTMLLGEAILDYSMNRRVPKRTGNGHPFMAPHGCYPCRDDDKWVSIAVSSDEEWDALCRAMGNPDWAKDERFGDSMSRWRNRKELDQLIGEWTRKHNHYEVMHFLQQVGVKAGAVLNIAEMVEDHHYKERGFFETVAHPEAGTHPHPGVPWKLSRTPGKIRRPAPCFAEHNDYVFKELLGIPPKEIERLTQEKVISTTPAL